MRLTLTQTLAAFGLVLMTVFGLAIAIQLYALRQLRVEGPEYARVVDAKDFVADILPPPLFLIEPYLLALEGVAHPDVSAAMADKIGVLEASYHDRIDLWSRKELPDEITDMIDRELRPASDAFWSEMDRNVLPALREARPVASEALSKLRGDFLAQRAAVEKLVDVSNAYMRNVEEAASATASSLQTLVYAVSAFAFLVLAGGLLLFRRRSVAPMTDMGRYMAALRDGDYTTLPPYLERADEVGDMARVLAHFREAILERRRMAMEKLAQAEAEARDRSERLARESRTGEELRSVVETLGAALERLSHFDIHTKIDTAFPRDFELLRQNFNKSLDVFEQTMRRVLAKSGQIRTNTAALEGSSDDLSLRTERQAATLEETAAAVHRITERIRSARELTERTKNRSSHALQNVNQSSVVVGQAVEAMSRIAAASSQIGSITGVIDEIAFQTNLLALNAGVEAARAGEAGKGFAVVAQEVRELAQRSAKAAREINELISRSSDEVKGGVELVSRTGQALTAIETDIGEIVRDMDAIAQGSSDQSHILEEVNATVERIDQLTQQNASMVEKSTAATHALADEVGELVSLVGQFVSEHPAPRSRAA
jgi:methyl-accepting chemotaxis protein